MPRTGSPGSAPADNGALGEARTAVQSSPAPGRKRGGIWVWVRGKLLFPAILAILSLASRLVGRGNDGLR